MHIIHVHVQYLIAGQQCGLLSAPAISEPNEQLVCAQLQGNHGISEVAIGVQGKAKVVGSGGKPGGGGGAGAYYMYMYVYM